jgi:hypothetical protein
MDRASGRGLYRRDVAKLGHPIGVVDPERFHLVAPFETDPRQRREAATGRSVFRQAVSHQGVRAARIAKSRSGEVPHEHEVHPEAKGADAAVGRAIAHADKRTENRTWTTSYRKARSRAR